MPVPLSQQAGIIIIIATITITATPKIRVQNGSGAGKGREAKRLRGLFSVRPWVATSTSVIVSRMTPVDTLNDLRYPIGHFSRPASSMAGIRAAHIQTLRLLPERLTSAVAGLDDNQLDTPYRDGGWTVRQVVHHVADSHANAYVRMKLALTEDWPTIKPYDEAAWADLSDARWLPVGVSLDLIAALHARWVSLLESLSDEDFHRGYVHPDGGRQNLAQVLALYEWHSRHHTAHIANLRSRLGW